MDDETLQPTKTGGGRAGGAAARDEAASYLADKMRPLSIATRTPARPSLQDGYERDKRPGQGRAKGAPPATTGPMTSTPAKAGPPPPAAGGRRAVEQNFILSTLKGVANALKSSHRNSLRQDGRGRPTSAVSSVGTPPASCSSSSSSATSTPHSTIGRRRRASRAAALADDDDPADDRSLCSIGAASSRQHSSPASSSCSSGRRERHGQHQRNHLRHRHSTPIYGAEAESASGCSSPSSAGSNLSSSNTIDCYAGGANSASTNNFNVTISSNHLSLLESMRFDHTSDVESLKKDLIRICRENRLEILAHYVAQVG